MPKNDLRPGSAASPPAAALLAKAKRLCELRAVLLKEQEWRVQEGLSAPNRQD